MEKRVQIKRGKIKFFEGKYVKVVTEIDGNETLDLFILEELISAFKDKKE